MSFDRCAVIGGPCSINTCFGRFETEGDVIVSVKRTFRDLETSLAGKVGRLINKTELSIKFTPLPIMSYAPLLISKQPTDIGESLFGCTDCFMDILGRDGIKRRFKAVAVTKPPSMTFSSRKSFFGEVEFGAVVANNVNLSTIGSVTVVSSAAFVEPSIVSDTALWTARCGRLSWGEDEPFDEIHTNEGIVVDVTYDTEAREDDCNGVTDTKLTGVNIKVTAKPSNLAHADFDDLMPLDGPDAIPGTNISGTARALIVEHYPLSPNGLTCEIFSAAVTEASLGWGAKIDRFGNVVWEGVGSVDPETNIANPLFMLSVTA